MLFTVKITLKDALWLTIFLYFSFPGIIVDDPIFIHTHHTIRFIFFYTMTIAPPILFIPSPHYSNFDCDGRSAEKAKGSAQSIVLVTEQRVVDLLWVLAVGWFKAFLIGSPFLFLYFIHNSVHRLNFWESVSLWRFPKCSHSKMDVGGLVCVVLLLINGSGVMF